jgi:CPA2 family monovalent cation:H+ antiporter-2
VHDSQILRDVAIIFGTAVVVAWLFRRLHAPSIVGFLITGIMIGPDALQLVNSEEVGPFSEIGLILLLFLIGLELSPKPLIRMGNRLLVAATLQMGITGGIALTVARVGGADWPAALIIGLACALSSTAIVLTQLSERQETTTVTGMIVVGTLLLQDVVVILVMLTLPILASSSGEGWKDTASQSGIALGVVVLAFVFGRRLINFGLQKALSPGTRDLSALFAVLMACGGAWLAAQVGWSPALGACIVGLLLAGTSIRHQLMADILPFRDVFNALFFISLGMTVDLDEMTEHWLLVLLAIAATFVIKTIVTAASIRITGWPIRPALQSGLALCTVSEFGYVLALEASRYGFVDEQLFGILTGFAVGTMALGAPIVPASATLTSLFLRWTPGAPQEAKAASGEDAHERLRDHVIVIGYGINGKNLAAVFQRTNIPCCVLEMNPHLAEEARNDGARVIVGDAGSNAILDSAGLAHAKAVVVAINDAAATERIVAVARTARPDLYILARTRFFSEIDALYAKGANRVIPEDFETSIEILVHVLRQMNLPNNIINAQVEAIRSGRYGILRGKATDRAATQELMAALQRTATHTHYIAEDSPVNGQTVAGTDLRKRSGATIIAIVRGSDSNTNPPPDFTIRAGDLLVLVGSHAQIDAATAMLENRSEEPPD